MLQLRVPRMRLSALLSCAGVLAALGGCASDPPAAKSEAATEDSVVAAEARVPASRPVVTNAAAAEEAAPPVVLTGEYAAYPAARALVDRLVRVHGLDRAELTRAFSRLQRQEWILDLVNRPHVSPAPGPTGAWTRYRARFITPGRIDQGVRFWREHARSLERAEARYGVPPWYVVAIIGVETHYGANVGRHKVINCLATLAFDFPRRSDYFRGELETFMVMAHDEGFDPFEPVGSYAGAMGLGQFMPSSFGRFAVDFDGDGRRDLWDPEDAIGSVANYLHGQGWRAGEGVAVRADTRGGAARALKADYTTSYSLSALARLGVTSRIPLDGRREVSLLRLDARGGYQYWLGLHNFYVITRYNHSTYYAMAVHQLADALRKRRHGSNILTRREGAGALSPF